MERAFLPADSADAESLKCCQASPFQENLPVSAGASPQMSREEQAAPPALPARWEDHFLGDTIIVPWGGGRG